MGFVNGSDSMTKNARGRTQPNLITRFWRKVRNNILTLQPGSMFKLICHQAFFCFCTANIVLWNVSVHRCVVVCHFWLSSSAFKLQSAVSVYTYVHVCMYLCSSCFIKAVFDLIAAMNPALDIAWSHICSDLDRLSLTRSLFTFLCPH